ncbi:MAG: NAD(P)-dependent oxidoreductase [Kofleriaceae bacterium]
MRTLLFGASSMLGWSIVQGALRASIEVAAFCNGNTRILPAGASHRIDLDEEAAVEELFRTIDPPSLIIHCAGVCDVADCERSPEFAQAVNVDATRFLCAHAPPSARIVYCSSDHVFGGDAGPYFEDSPPAPISVYGRTRVEAEALVRARPGTLVIRSGLWIGPSGNGRIGHLDWLRSRHERNLPMTVVSDEIRSAVWAEDAAARVWQLARSTVTGTRHITATRAIDRPALAAFVNARFSIGATFDTAPRATRSAPHLGNVELATRYADALAVPLRSPIESAT